MVKNNRSKSDALSALKLLHSQLVNELTNSTFFEAIRRSRYLVKRHLSHRIIVLRQVW